LPFAKASFDTVVCTFTLCSIADPARALLEVSRVLKHDGRFLFLEHGLAPDPAVARWQCRLTPLQRRLAGGCHLDRDTPSLLGAAGLAVRKIDRYYLRRVPRFVGFVNEGWAGRA
jgi:ubiquinone/menaquinone biosynthesis C-methylase UbiE